MNPVALQTVLSWYQPLTTTPDEVSRYVDACCRPLLAAIRERPKARLALHINGNLLDQFARHHESLLFEIKALAKSGQVEVLGGLFYGGLPHMLSDADVGGQVEMMSEFWESYLGAAPVGMWLPKGGFCVELPRLMADSDIRFIYAPARLLAGTSLAGGGCGVLRRGEDSLAVFALDEQLSEGIARDDIDTWVDALIDRASPYRLGHVHTVHVAGEALCRDGVLDTVRADLWLAAIGGERSEITSVLPTAALSECRPASLVKLLDDGTELSAEPHMQTLHALMARTSARLRDAIAIMEDEDLVDDWSDELATIQRLLFAAQSPDAYLSSTWSADHRDATLTNLFEASRRLDVLQQGEEDWIEADEEDRDSDLFDEVFVSTQSLMAWLCPERGGEVRALVHRPSLRSMLDYPPLTAFLEAPPRTSDRDTDEIEHDATVIDGVSPASAPPSCFGRGGTPIPAGHQGGIRAWVVEHGTSPAELESGSAVQLFTKDPIYRIEENSIDADGDCNYRLRLETDGDLAGHKPRHLRLWREISVPIDQPRISLRTQAELNGPGDISVLLEVPLRLGAEPEEITVNHQPVGLTRERPTPRGPTEWNDTTHVSITGGEQQLYLELSTPTDVWLLPHAERRDCLTLVVALRVEEQAEVTATLGWE